MQRARQSGTFFRGREFSRLAMMVLLLVLLFLMIQRTREPSTWSWFERRGSSGADSPAPRIEPHQPVPAKAPMPGKSAEKPPAKATAPSVPLDEDPDEIDALSDELQAVNDKTMVNPRFEMRAYWRLMRWAQASSIEDLARRAKRGVVLNDFVRSPDKLRGKLIVLELNVRKVVGTEAAPNNAGGVKRVFNLWGPSDESGVWLYDCATAELPAGIPVGDNLDEKVKFYGFFLKIEAYGDRLGRGLYAPLLIGRAVRIAPPPPPPSAAESPWAWWILGGVAALMVFGFAATFGLFRRRSTVQIAEAEGRRKEFQRWMAEDIPHEEGFDSGSPWAESDDPEDAQSATDGDSFEGILPPDPDRE